MGEYCLLLGTLFTTHIKNGIVFLQHTNMGLELINSGLPEDIEAVIAASFPFFVDRNNIAPALPVVDEDTDPYQQEIEYKLDLAVTYGSRFDDNNPFCRAMKAFEYGDDALLTAISREIHRRTGLVLIVFSYEFKKALEGGESAVILGLQLRGTREDFMQSPVFQKYIQ